MQKNTRLILILVAALGAGSLLFCFRLDISNLHYDGVARLNIARRVLDHAVPHYSHLGTIWLPLQHILLLPLVRIDFLWTTGLAGGLLSWLSFCAACYCVLQLSRRLYASDSVLALVPPLALALNPNVLYLQTTPLVEVLYLALYLGFIYQLDQYLDGQEGGAVWRMAGLAALASLTRYDGWILVVWGGLCVLWKAIRTTQTKKQAATQAVVYGALASTGILLWFAYNQHVFGDWLAFLKGPYSTKARIGQILTQAGLDSYPPNHQIVQAVHYYLRATVLVAGLLPVAVSMTGLAIYLIRDSRQARYLSLGFGVLFPPVFYIYHLVSGTGIIYVPSLVPYGVLNIRYVALCLPMMYLFLPAGGRFLFESIRRMSRARFRQKTSSEWAIAGAVILLLAAQSVYQVGRGRNGVICLEEAYVNGLVRKQTAHEMGAHLREVYDGKPVLMDLSEHGIIPQRAGISLVHVINESWGNIWKSTLADPAAAAGWVVLQEGDQVSRFLNAKVLRNCFEPVFEATGPHEPPLFLYRRKPCAD
ncbi:MAG: hypothetical protein AB1898_17550 [Acidobacteriota bacterium]